MRTPAVDQALHSASASRCRLAPLLALALAGCAAERPTRATEAVGRPSLVAAPSDPARSPTESDACASGADSVYVLDDQGRIQLFEPDGPVEQRFRVVATPDCEDSSGPQTMSLDHRGYAWLLFSSGKLFTMKLPEGRCEPTRYQHPGMGGVMGMTFTAALSGSPQERLFISDREGLFEVKLPALEATLVESAVPPGELAGGPDGLLFHVDLDSGTLTELDTTSFTRRPVHTFGAPGGAFTLLRHRRGFFYFSADQSGPSHVYRWSPRSAETIDLGMAPDGIRVLGRAQSVCVEWSEGDGSDANGAGPKP